MAVRISTSNFLYILFKFFSKKTVQRFTKVKVMYENNNITKLKNVVAVENILLAAKIREVITCVPFHQVKAKDWDGQIGLDLDKEGVFLDSHKEENT